MNNILTFLKGKKTYLLMVAAIGYSIGGYFTGHFDQQATLEMIWTALTAGALRAGIKNTVRGTDEIQ